MENKTDEIITAGNTQYKTVGVQWFAKVWFSHQLFPWWIGTCFENPTVSYCQPLCGIQEKPTAQTAHLVFADTQSQR